MENGFSFELYETVFEQCFIHMSRYKNGNLQLSLFGIDPETQETAHFADITLEQNKVKLKENEIVIDCKYKPTLLPQLEELGILETQVGACVIKSTFYPIYTINFSRVMENSYYLQELCVA